MLAQQVLCFAVPIFQRVQFSLPILLARSARCFRAIFALLCRVVSNSGNGLVELWPGPWGRRSLLVDEDSGKVQEVAWQLLVTLCEVA